MSGIEAREIRLQFAPESIRTGPEKVPCAHLISVGVHQNGGLSEKAAKARLKWFVMGDTVEGSAVTGSTAILGENPRDFRSPQ